MALDLFKRVETRKGLFAVEKITLIYNLLTSILILFLFQRMDHPWHMLLDRAMIAAMTFLLMYLYRLAPCKFSAFVRIVIQMSLLSYWYPDTFEFNRFFRTWTMSLLPSNSLSSVDNLLSGSAIRFLIFWSAKRLIWDISSIIR